MSQPPEPGTDAAPVEAAPVEAAGPGQTRMRSKADLQESIRRHQRTVLVVNTRSRRGQRLYRHARAQLDAAGIGLLGVFPVTHPGQLHDSLTAALDLSPDLLIAGGGDGTISEAARRLAYRDVALGILPFGTTNNFARTLAIPLTLPGAIDVIAGGKVADVDLGRAGDATFANLVSAGLSTQVAARVPHQLKRVTGRAAYPLTALAVLPGRRPFRAVITVGARRVTVITHQLNIANGSFHAGRPITSDATADDRLLLVYALGGPGRRGLITATIRHALLGARRTLTEPAFLATSDLWLDTDPPLPLDVDGEIRGHTPTRITLAPNALRVMVAQAFPDT